MKCQEAEELIHAYLLGAVDEVERRRLEAHIRGCPGLPGAVLRGEPVHGRAAPSGRLTAGASGPQEAHPGHGRRRAPTCGDARP